MYAINDSLVWEMYVNYYTYTPTCVNSCVYSKLHTLFSGAVHNAEQHRSQGSWLTSFTHTHHINILTANYLWEMYVNYYTYTPTCDRIYAYSKLYTPFSGTGHNAEQHRSQGSWLSSFKTKYTHKVFFLPNRGDNITQSVLHRVCSALGLQIH